MTHASRFLRNHALRPALTVRAGFPPERIPIVYPLTSSARQTIDRNFTHHPPAGNQAERYGDIRNRAGELAQLVSVLAPPSRELSLAVTKIEEAVFWANAAIARGEHWEGGSLIAQPTPTTPPRLDDVVAQLVDLASRVESLTEAVKADRLAIDQLAQAQATPAKKSKRSTEPAAADEASAE